MAGGVLCADLVAVDALHAEAFVCLVGTKLRVVSLDLFGVGR